MAKHVDYRKILGWPRRFLYGRMGRWAWGGMLRDPVLSHENLEDAGEIRHEM
jgi:hypothetical protein